VSDACIDLSIRGVIVAVLAALLYGLWWVHNDHPFIAAGLGAAGIVFYDWLLLITRKLIWADIRDLRANQKKLLARLEEDEQHIEELTADEDGSPWD